MKKFLFKKKQKKCITKLILIRICHAFNILWIIIKNKLKLLLSY